MSFSPLQSTKISCSSIVYPMVGIGTLKVSRYRYLPLKVIRYRYSELRLKCTDLLLRYGYFLKKMCNIKVRPLVAKKSELHALFRLGGVLSRLRCLTCCRHSFKFCSCRRRNGRRLLIAEPVVMNYGIFQGFNEVSNSANGAFTLDI